MKSKIKLTNLQGLPKHHGTPYHWIAEISSCRSNLLSNSFSANGNMTWPISIFYGENKSYGWGLVVTKAKANSNLETIVNPLKIRWAAEVKDGHLILTWLDSFCVADTMFVQSPYLFCTFFTCSKVASSFWTLSVGYFPDGHVKVTLCNTCRLPIN